MPQNNQGEYIFECLNFRECKTNSAISILNAIGIGFGGAIAIDIECKVRESLTARTRNASSMIVKSTDMDEHGLVARCVKDSARTLHFDIPKGKKIVIEIDSAIPIGVGLKSSCSVSTAVVKSVSSLFKDVDSETILEILSHASKASDASITGAFDDACACHLGGLVLTNNSKIQILKHTWIPSQLGE